MSMKIFGTEPARWVGIIGALLTAVAAFKNPWVSAGSAAAIIAFLTAVVTVWTTRPWQPGLLSGVVAAGAALVAEYGLHLADGQVAAISALALAVGNLFAVREQVIPKETAISNTTAAAAPLAATGR